MTRFFDHELAYKKWKPCRPTFSAHLLEENHANGRSLILHVENNFRRRTALELIEITKQAPRHDCNYSLIQIRCP